MASSSSSHQQNQELNAFPGSGNIRKVCESSRLFDVFINHRGPDVKTTLATQLYNSLAQLGIRAFLDSEEKELGTSFPSSIETAIRSAKVHIAIFSKRYAESAWCLAELDLMLQSEAKIIPVFYEVEPWELRHIEKGVYAEAFNKYQEKGRYLEKLNEWKKALHSLSLIAGEEFNSPWDCQKIVAAVQKEVRKKTCLHVAEHPVGLDDLVKDFERGYLDELVQDFENQCKHEEGKHKAKIVGIFGMGGAGKTTLAKELSNRKKSNYSGVSFLFDVREASAKSKLHRLQRQLVKDLFDKEPRFKSTEEGTSYLKDHLERKPHSSFLIVVDDIDHVEQLNALRIMDIVGRSCNSLVIVTTRDAGVLITAGITVGYNLKGIDRYYGRQLFCWHAFGQAHPSSGYEVMVDDFVDVCRGLPLSLLVLGRHVHGRDLRFWESELIKARKTQPQDVKKRLRISFDTLDDEEKQVFMDVACFFLVKPRSIAERLLEWSGWNAHNAIETLKDKCLIEKEDITFRDGYDGYGRESRLRMHDHLRDLGRELAVELSPPHRLWRPQDLKTMELMGFKTILARTDVRCFHSIFDESMGSSVTFFMGQSNNCFETSGSLLWLELEDNSTEQPSIPSWIPLQNLQYLKIKRGQLKTLWENSRQAPSQLKELHISLCPELKKLSLGHASCLERITIVDCKHLESVSGISNLAKLVELEISGCGKLEFEYLRLRGMNCLKSIIINGGGKVKYFELEGCQILKTLEFSCEELVELIIRGCRELKQLPYFIGASCLERIIIDGCDIWVLHFKGCQNLRSVSGNFRLTSLTITECPELEELPSLATVSWKLVIESCEKLQNISGIEEMHPPMFMGLSYCSKAVIRNCIHKLKSVPSGRRGMEMIGRAADGAESSLNQNLFCDAHIAADAVADAFTDKKCLYCCRRSYFTAFCDAHIAADAFSCRWSSLIGCFLVVVDSSTSVKDINESLNLYRDYCPSEFPSDLPIQVRQGEWIITMVACRDSVRDPIHVYVEKISGVLRRKGIMKKGFLVRLKEGEEWKSVVVLKTIVDKLHYL